MSDLDDLLAHEHEAGALDSEGKFTINPLRSQELLARYRLPEPQFYILKLVQAVVASGANFLDISTADGLELTFDGPAWTSQDIHMLAMPILPDRRLQHMAAALSVLWSLKPRSLNLQTELLDWRVEAGGSEKLNERELPGQRNQLRIEGEEGIWKRLTGAWRAEKALLYSHCRLCPIPLCVDGIPMNRLHQRAYRVGLGKIELGSPPPVRRSGSILLPERQPHDIPACRFAGEGWHLQLRNSDLRDAQARTSLLDPRFAERRAFDAQ